MQESAKISIRFPTAKSSSAINTINTERAFQYLHLEAIGDILRQSSASLHEKKERVATTYEMFTSTKPISERPIRPRSAVSVDCLAVNVSRHQSAYVYIHYFNLFKFESPWFRIANGT
jgi:hypothetical protein